MTRAAGAGTGTGIFLGWAAVGACLGAALLTPLTIAPVLLVVAVAAAALLLRRRRLNRACWGLLAGAGLISLYVGYLNRGGPGQVCTTTVTAQHCVSEWSPWPFLATGILLIVAGTGLFMAGRWGRRHA